MKKVLIVLLLILLTSSVISGLAYVSYTPDDNCENVKRYTEMYNEVSKKLGMTYREYNRLNVYESLALIKKDFDYGQIKATYDLAKEEEIKCITYMGMSKWERFQIDVYSGNFFD
jgi:hypothetical protein|tara:strand:+ start:721 stop:1065 length:345 start_codon:yes stop_codon:yes gene_type:complete